MLVSLIGSRGAGKSVVGQALARRLDWAWYDSDLAIESQTGKSITDLFTEYSESGFRDLEEQIISELVTHRATVLSLGGGAVLRESTRKRLRNAGIVIWLRVEATTILNRLAEDPHTASRRPPLTQLDPEAEVARILAERDPIYAATADHVLDVDQRSVEEIVEEICEVLRRRESL